MLPQWLLVQWMKREVVRDEKGMQIVLRNDFEGIFCISVSWVKQMIELFVFLDILAVFFFFLHVC